MNEGQRTTSRREGLGTNQRTIQPLREVGTLKKTQYWTFEEIEDAIREANLCGIDPQSLFGTASSGRDLAI